MFRLSLEFHSSVLEPDLHLTLRQVQRDCDLYPTRATEVLVEVKFLLQLQQLGVRVRSTQPTRVRCLTTGRCHDNSATGSWPMQNSGREWKIIVKVYKSRNSLKVVFSFRVRVRDLGLGTTIIIRSDINFQI